jgi:hypothetical protein
VIKTYSQLLGPRCANPTMKKHKNKEHDSFKTQKLSAINMNDSKVDEIIHKEIKNMIINQIKEDMNKHWNEKNSNQELHEIKKTMQDTKEFDKDKFLKN